MTHQKKHPKPNKKDEETKKKEEEKVKLKAMAILDFHLSLTKKVKNGKSFLIS
jgi:hypothetical protein